MQNNDEETNVEDWRNEHGLPDFKYLNSLASDGSVEAREKLKSIAEDIDADFDADASPEELVEMIMIAAARNEDTSQTSTT